MKKFIKTIFCISSLIVMSFVYAMTPEESRIAVTEQELKLMQDGYTYYPPTPEQKKAGLISSYGKGTCSKGHECGFREILPSSENWSKGSVKVPSGSGKKNSLLKLTSFHTIEMQNENTNTFCIRLDMKLSQKEIGASNSQIRYGCLTPHSHYLGNFELYVAGQFPYTGNFQIQGNHTIYDYPLISSVGYGRALIS